MKSKNLDAPSLYSKILIFLLSLTFLSLFINQAPHNLTITILFLFTCLFGAINYKQFTEQLKRHSYFYVALGLYLIIYLLINTFHLGIGADLLYAVKRSRWIIFSLICVPILPSVVFKNKKAQSLFLKFVLIPLSLLCLLIIYDSFTRLVWMEASTSLWFKSSLQGAFSSRASWTYNAIPFSKMAVFSSGFLFLASFFTTTKQRFFIRSISIAMFSVSILSLTRATWLSLFLCAPIILIYSKRIKILGPSLLFLIAFCALIGFSPILKKRLSSISSTTSYSNKYRIEHWKANLKVLAANPFFGIGYAQNRLEKNMKPYMNEFHKDPRRVYGMHPHNEYLDVSVGMGIVSLLLFLLILSYPILYKLKTVGFYKLSLTEFLSSLFLVYIYLTAFFDKITLTSWSMILFCWAVLLYGSNELKLKK